MLKVKTIILFSLFSHLLHSLPPQLSVEESASEEKPRFTPHQWENATHAYRTTSERFVNTFPTYAILKGTHALSNAMRPTLKRFPVFIGAQLLGVYLQTKYIREHTHLRDGGLPFFQPPERVMPWEQAYFRHHLSLFGLTETEFVRHFPFQRFVEKMRQFPHLKINKAYGYLPLPIQGRLHRREAALAIERLQEDGGIPLQALEETIVQQGQTLLEGFFSPLPVEALDPQAYIEWYELQVTPQDAPLTLAQKLTRFILKLKDLPRTAPTQQLIHTASEVAGNLYEHQMNDTQIPAEKYDYGQSAITLFNWAIAQTPEGNDDLEAHKDLLEFQLLELAIDHQLVTTPA